MLEVRDLGLVVRYFLLLLPPGDPVKGLSVISLSRAILFRVTLATVLFKLNVLVYSFKAHELSS